MDRELDREIKRLTRKIKKNDDLRKQCRDSASMLEVDHGSLPESSTLRAAELRGTAAALESENDVLSYKLKLRSRLRERVRFMRQAADATWRACGGRGAGCVRGSSCCLAFRVEESLFLASPL